MKYIALLLCLLAVQSLSAQTTPVETSAQPKPTETPAQNNPTPAVTSPATVKTVVPQPALDDKKLTLQERFLIMKLKSQSYNDYKVIKETVLDGVWKITRDSINARKQALSNANKTIAELKGEVNNSQSTLKQKEASMQDVIYDSTHITVLGIGMSKQFFVGAVGVVLVALVLALLLISGRLKSIYSSMKEKSDLATAITNEYEDYKRKALDKQTKLSRELQNERNKLAEMRR